MSSKGLNLAAWTVSGNFSIWTKYSRAAVNNRQPNNANQRQPNNANQRKPNNANQRQPNNANQRQPNNANQRQPNNANQRQPNNANQSPRRVFSLFWLVIYWFLTKMSLVTQNYTRYTIYREMAAEYKNLQYICDLCMRILKSNAEFVSSRWHQWY